MRQIDGFRMLAKELAKIGCDALDYRVNGIDMPVGSLNGVAWKKVENQQTNPLIVASSFGKIFITFPQHQFVRSGLGWFLPFDGRLRSNDDGFAIIFHDTLQPDVVIENPVLEGEPVEIFGWGCAMSQRTEGNAIAPLPVEPRCPDITPGALLKKHIMLTAVGESRRQAAAAAQLPAFFGPPDEPPLLRFNTF